MLRIEDLCVEYDNRKIISNLSYSFPVSKHIAIVGASGIGKTTLLNVLAGLQKPNAGSVISSFSRPAYIFQDPRLFPWLTSLENVKLVCADQQIASYLIDALINDTDAKNKYPDELSGGMKHRIAIARALAYDSDIVFMDEPFKGLDIQTRQTVREFVFKKLNGKTVILVTHDPDDLPFCDIVLKMSESPVTRLESEESGKAVTE